jgi:YD repeat-containing protein
LLEFEVSSEGRVTHYGYHANGLLGWKRAYTAYQYSPGSTHILSSADMHAWIASLGVNYSLTTFEDYRYDARGDIAEVVRWGTPPASWGWNGNEGYSHSFFVRDHQGRILNEFTAPEHGTAYIYDGLGRVVVKTDSKTGQTSIQFNDAATTTIVTEHTGQTTTSVYSKVGELLSQSDVGWHVAGGTDTFLYDRVGNLRRSIDSTGRKMYHIWDKAGRKVADLSYDGSLTEYRYDAADRLIGTGRYTHWAAHHLGTLDNPNAELEISQIRPPAHSYDVWEWTVYDQAGRVAQTILGDGSTTRYEYDLAGRLIKTFGHGNLVPAATIQAYMAGTIPSIQTPSWHVLDTVTRSFYDGDGLLIGNLAPDGGLIRMEYDGKGRKIAEHRYVNFAPDDGWTRFHGTLDQIFNSIPKDAAFDITQRWVYDGQDQLRYEIDGLGKVTEYRYWQGHLWFSIGKPRRIIEHAVALPSGLTDFSYVSVQSHLAPHIGNPGNRTSWNVYNEKGQLSYSVDSGGQVARMIYDHAGRLIRTARYAETVDMNAMGASAAEWAGNLAAWTDARVSSARTERNYYNARGDLRATVDAESYATVFHHDTEGRVTLQQRYANQLPVEDWWSFHEVWLSDKGNATNRYYGYDSQGREIETYDENGTRHWYGYYQNGLKAWQIAGAWQDGESRVLFVYDQAGRIKHELVTNNELETYGWLGNSSTTQLHSRNRLVAPSHAYQVGLSVQGELQIYHHGNLVWSNGIRDTAVGASYTLDAQNDGNFVIYRHSPGQSPVAIWSTGTTGTANGPTFMVMQDDGNFVLYRGTPDNNQGAIWASGTNGATVSGNGSWQWTKNYTYNGLGQVAAIHDAQGIHTHYGYDRAGRLARLTDGMGGVTEYHYNAAGQQKRTRDARGNDSYTYYDRTGRMIANLDAEGYLTRTSYDGFRQVSSVIRLMNKANGVGTGGNPPHVDGHSLDATTQYQYDKLGRVTLLTDAEGHQETYRYNAFGQLAGKRNKLGGVTDYYYDKRGLLAQETLLQATYRPDGSQQSGHISNQFYYDSRGNMIRKIEAAGFTEERNTWLEYDAGNRLISKKTDARWVVTNGTDYGVTSQPTETYQYDRRGNITQVVAPDGKRTLRWYNLSNQITHEVSNGGTLTRYFYAADGMLSETRVYDQRVTPPANAATMPPAGGINYRSVRYVYDNLNRLIESRTGPVHTAQMNGDTLSVQWRELVTSYQYDAMGNVTRTTDADGHYVQAWFDKLGRKTIEIDAGGFRTDWSHDANGNVVSERRQALSTWNAHWTGDDRVTTFAYDKMGRRTVLHRHNVLVHDGFGNQTNGQSAIYYSYNGLGQVVWKTEANGEWFAKTYDTFGRLIQEHNNPVSTVEGVGHIGLTYAYDGLNNLVRTHKWGWGGTAGRTSTFAYSKGGLLETATDATGNTRKFVHDAAGRVTRQEYWRHQHWLGGAYEAVATDYDADGRVSANGMAKWNGSSWSRRIAEGDLDTSMTIYNAHGEVAERGINNVYSEKFAYDQAGRIYRSNSGDGVWRYFVHDGRGNQTVMVASEGMDIANQSLDWALDRWGGDRNALRHNFVDGITATITRYDGRSLAIEVIEPQRELQSSVRQHLHSHRHYNAFGEVAFEQDVLGNRIYYTYNSMGRQIKIESPSVLITSESGIETSVNPTEHRYYDLSGRLTGQRDANGNLTRYTLFGGTGYDGKEALVTSTTFADGNAEYRSYDMHGDLRQINDRGRVSNMYYDAMSRLTATEQAGMWQWRAYDNLGQVWETWSSIQPYEARTFIGYDAQGRVVAQNAMGGEMTHYGYWFHPGQSTPGGLGTLGGWQKNIHQANGRLSVEHTDYFGRLTTTVNNWSLADHQISNSHYDLAGRLTYRDGGTPMHFTWLNTGKMRSQFVDSYTQVESAQHLVRRETYYHYDAAGKLGQQITYRTGTEAVEINVPGNPGDGEPGEYYWQYNPINEVLENQTASYDALGRVTLWQSHGGLQSPAAHTYFKYDANGNVRRTVGASASVGQNGAIGASQSYDQWFRFDSMNRVVTDKGSLENGAIVRGTSGKDIYYHANGDRAGTLTTQVVSGDYGYDYETGQHYGYYSFTTNTREIYDYDAAGRLTAVHSRSWDENYGEASAPTYLRGQFWYDVAGRQTQQIDWQQGTGQVAYQSNSYFDAHGRVSQVNTTARQGNDTIISNSTYDYGGTWQGAAYALGQAQSVSAETYKNGAHQSTSTTTNSYVFYQGAVQSHISHSQTGSPIGNTWLSYNYVAGQAVLASATINDGRSRTVSYATNMMGEVQRRQETPNGTGGGAPTQYWFRFGGKEMGTIGNDGSRFGDYGGSINTRTAVAPSGIPGAFQNGSSYGQAEQDFGSRLSDITSYHQGSVSNTLRARGGETLSSIAASIYGDASLWYKIAQANGLSGDATLIEGQSLTLPAGVTRNTFNAATFQPYDPASTIGDVSPTTAAAAPPKKKGCGAAGAILLAIIAIAVTVVTAGAAFTALGGVGSFASAGVSATSIAAGAIGGAAGSIVSQAVGVATGIQEKFSWKAVAMAAIGGGVGAGMGNSFSGLKGAAQAMARGAASSAITQGIGVVTGLQDKFDWAGVAAAGIGAGVASKVGTSKLVQKLGADTMAADIVINGASALANAATRSLIDGSDFGDNVIAALPDVIGGAIGRRVGGAVLEGMNAPPQTAANAFAGEAAAITITGAPLNNPSYEPLVAPIILMGEALDIPAFESLKFNPLELVLGGSLRGGTSYSDETASSIRARIELYNDIVGQSERIEYGSDSFSGISLNAGQSAGYPTKRNSGMLTYSAMAGTNPGRITSDWYRYAGDDGVTRILSTQNGDGIGVFSGGNVSFGDLGINVNFTRFRGRQSANVAALSMATSAEPTFDEQRAAYNAGRHRASSESFSFMAKTIWENIGVVGAVEGIKTFVNNPTAGNLTMVALGVVPGGKMAGKLFDVGSYGGLKGAASALGADAHHVGQKAIMKKLIPGYDAVSAPAIIVPKVGHTVRSLERGIVSRKLITNPTARKVLARDIWELRRVYPDIPNSQLQKLIKANKTMYPDAFAKKVISP